MWFKIRKDSFTSSKDFMKRLISIPKEATKLDLQFLEIGIRHARYQVLLESFTNHPEIYKNIDTLNLGYNELEYLAPDAFVKLLKSIPKPIDVLDINGNIISRYNLTNAEKVYSAISEFIKKLRIGWDDMAAHYGGSRQLEPFKFLPKHLDVLDMRHSSSEMNYLKSFGGSFERYTTFLDNIPCGIKKVYLGGELFMGQDPNVQVELLNKLKMREDYNRYEFSNKPWCAKGNFTKQNISFFENKLSIMLPKEEELVLGSPTPEI